MFLRRPDLLRLVAARVMGGIALQMTSVAMGWLVYDRTGSAYALGLIGLFQFLPALPLVAVTGHAADSFDRRWVSAAAFAAQILGGIAIFGFAISHLGMAWLYALVLGIGATATIWATNEAETTRRRSKLSATWPVAATSGMAGRNWNSATSPRA